MPPRILFSESSARDASKAIRLLDPLRRLAQEGLVTPVPLSSIVGDRRSISRHEITRAVASIDGIFLHILDVNAASAAVLFAIWDAADAARIPVIVDADDGYFLPSDTGVFDGQLAPHLPAMKQACERATVMSVATEALQQFFASIARGVVWVPNVVDMRPDRVADWDRKAGSDRRVVHIGWAGGPTHIDDLAVFLAAMRVIQRRSRARFTLFGLYDQPIDPALTRVRRLTRRQRALDPAVQRFGALADALQGVTFAHKPSVPFAAFPDALSDLAFDIGVCPLRDTAFNRLRSAVKFYQYAAVGAVTVASNVGPYPGETVALVDNEPSHWVDALMPLIEDGERRGQLLAEQREFVGQHRSWTAVRSRYLELLTGGCRQGQPTVSACRPSLAAAASR